MTIEINIWDDPEYNASQEWDTLEEAGDMDCFDL